MKTQFTINALVAIALPKVTDQDRLSQACESYLNSMKAIEEKSARSGMREVKKSNDSRTTETLQTTYAGERNIVSDFIGWHDKVVSISAKAVKIGCVLNVSEVPPRFAEWLGKFETKGQPKAGQTKAVKGSQGNGQHAEARAMQPVAA
jgi:hypothetical protein